MAKTKNKALDLFVDSASYQRTSLFDETETTPKRMGRPPKNENKKFSSKNISYFFIGHINLNFFLCF